MAAFNLRGFAFICGSKKNATRRKPLLCAVAAHQPNTLKSGIVAITLVR